MDPTLMEPLRPHLDRYRHDPEFNVQCPSWNSDIEWISPNSLAMFRVYRQVFDALDPARAVRPLLDLKHAPRLYSGFLVRRSHYIAPNFHEDWFDTQHQAFTLITPLQMGDKPAALIYKKTDGSIGRYAYRTGKAILFGDKFVHSTAPGSSDPPLVLLSFTFGTDRMRYWSAIARTGANQGNLVWRPDGSFLCHDIDD
ncbi:hypothetical protein [Cyanobium sp. CH-040]|uniref:hypothetical protein n=1 Tax=Cyanobium sp. CH-040 TaxID=2823708 RepID=UPI0020CC3EC0|nr:hypothetical protein [Cyanobium sp. CH-040]